MLNYDLMEYALDCAEHKDFELLSDLMKTNRLTLDQQKRLSAILESVKFDLRPATKKRDVDLRVSFVCRLMANGVNKGFSPHSVAELVADYVEMIPIFGDVSRETILRDDIKSKILSPGGSHHELYLSLLSETP